MRLIRVLMNIKVNLKSFHNSQNITNELLIEIKTYFNAIWKDGPLNYIMEYYDYTRKQNKKVNLKCLHNSQNINNEFLIEFNRYSTRFYSYNKFKIFGISQNPDIKDYILVLQNVYCDKCDKCFTDKYGIWCKSCQINDIEKNITNWTSGNEKIDNLIQEMSKVNLKCLYNSQNITNELLNEVRTYSIRNHKDNNPKIYGISQNPDTKNYVIVLQDVYCDKCIKYFTDQYYKCQFLNEIKVYSIENHKDYFTPEVLKGKPYTQASDIYSFVNTIEVIDFTKLSIKDDTNE
ncbi:kinase-like domain-containing protein [Rhizophagus irregularis DAOM 181602=DAOM 197198]|nr:kinase-like domain-containing protein [Rhizophagus irregularis DAOM 181602=DAOM 197198]